MQPKIIGQLYDDPSIVIVKVNQTDENVIVKILNLKMGTVSHAIMISDLVRLMLCEDYKGEARLEEILETHQLQL